MQQLVGGIRYLRLKLIYCLCPILTFRYKMHYRPLNLNRLQFFIDSGRLNPNAPITMYHLWRSGVTGGRIKDGVVLLGGVSSSAPLLLWKWCILIAAGLIEFSSDKWCLPISYLKNLFQSPRIIVGTFLTRAELFKAGLR